MSLCVPNRHVVQAFKNHAGKAPHILDRKIWWRWTVPAVVSQDTHWIRRWVRRKAVLEAVMQAVAVIQAISWLRVPWVGKLFHFKAILIRVLVTERKIKTLTEIDG
jgi:hypothetical protein